MRMGYGIIWVLHRGGFSETPPFQHMQRDGLPSGGKYYELRPLPDLGSPTFEPSRFTGDFRENVSY